MSISSKDSYTVSSDFRIRDTAKKYKYARWTQQEQHFSIDTAAIATAFPDFTQGSTSEIDIVEKEGDIFGNDDLSLSIELGRGKSTLNHFPKPQSSTNIHFNSIDTTDMLRQRVLTRSTTPRKDNMAPTSSPYISNASRTSSGERKQLAELRAQVQSDTENSTMGTDRTTTTTFPMKSRGSRFAQNKTDTQQIPANISARFTSPAKSVTRSNAAQPTQSSFIIHASGDMTGRDTEDLGLPVIVENGEVQQRKSSARRFRRVSGIRTPEEEKELWLLSEKLKAENAALKTRAEYQQHVNNSLHEQNAKILREMSEFKTKMTSEFEVKIIEMSRKIETVLTENTAIKAEYASIKAENAALHNENGQKAHELSRLEGEMARLRTDIQKTSTDLQFESTKSKAQKESTHTFTRESRVEFQNTNTDLQFESAVAKAQQLATHPSRPESRVEIQGTNTDVQFEIPSAKARKAPAATMGAESRVEFEGTNDNVQFEIPIMKTQKVSTRTFRPKSAVEEPTLRPSVDPQQALATVMFQLNEELAALKEEYNQVSSQYMGLDPSLKKRMRKEFKAEMDRLLQSIERKADQVYLLQDVHEGILPYEDE
ncbi:hypothetical protein EG329_011168 [Mollisiaceae sp. DMI_Dod_QoI]|nr:hypothetical protein EG329_011168 [Helotiales sp. DMI_Dod_QoI]